MCIIMRIYRACTYVRRQINFSPFCGFTCDRSSSRLEPKGRTESTGFCFNPVDLLWLEVRVCVVVQSLGSVLSVNTVAWLIGIPTLQALCCVIWDGVYCLCPMETGSSL